MKPRIHLIGGPGSGKSYAAARLSSQFDVPAYELDDLYWDNTTSGYDVRREPAARDQQLASLVERDGWIIEGVFYGWVAPSFAAADIIIVLTPSIVVRQWRVIKRFALRRAGRVPSRNESLASLWRLLCWSQTFDVQHLGEAHRAVTTLGRTWVECRTLEDVLAATCYLERR
jgi:adenylate kinase family enzyme